MVTSTGAQVIWSKNESLLPEDYREWRAVKVDLTPWSGQTVQLSFGFDSIDGIANDGEGLFFDDISILSSCEAPTLCATSADCDDSKVCTVDSCEANVCIHAPQSGCCAVDAECNDGDICTTDTCIDSACVTTAVAGCCTSDADCKDGLDCTTDTCEESTNTCVFSATQDCCQADSDCDDGDTCTVNTCDKAVCQSTPVDAPECCVEESWFFTEFDGGDDGGFVVLGDGSAVGWTTSEARSWSLPASLYYGDPISGDYDSGATTFGTAFSPLVNIAGTAQKPTLTFQLFADIEVVASRDRFTIALLINGTQQVVWTKADLSASDFNVWKTVQIPLPEAVVGANVRVVLAFDSVDGTNNGGEGLYVDDMRLWNACD